jgi:hypothetical protein
MKTEPTTRMNHHLTQSDWFFPIEEAPVLVTVTHKGVVRDVRVPHKKALIAADTGDIVGIVGTGYKVFTNQQAVTLCHKFCLEAFPDTTPAEWTFVEGHGPGTRSWAAMDIHHSSHAMNLWGNEVRDVKRQYGVDWIIVTLYPTD